MNTPEPHPFQKLFDHLNTEEGKKAAKEYFEREDNKENILNSQLERFHNRNLTTEEFISLVDKIKEKYSSDKYYFRWMNRGIEPPKDLLYFLHSYAEKYGRESTEEEFKKHGNEFADSVMYIKGIFFILMFGQGSAVITSKEFHPTSNT